MLLVFLAGSAMSCASSQEAAKRKKYKAVKSGKTLPCPCDSR
jgi:hypothetical protein